MFASSKGLNKFGVQLKPRKKERKSEDICSPQLAIFFACLRKELYSVAFVLFQGKKKKLIFPFFLILGASGLEFWLDEGRRGGKKCWLLC